jgi:ATP-binding cassette subfamily F protein 3
MIILNLDAITRHFGANDVLRGVSAAFQDGTVIGLVGPNGSGKSTLMRILAGEDQPDGGSIYRYPGQRVARLAQDPELDVTRTVLEEAMTASPALRAMAQELEELEERMGRPEVYEDPRRLQNTIDAHGRATAAYAAAGGPAFAGRVRAALRGLGFGEADLDLPVAVLSGGQKKLLGLAKVLVEDPDLLLLDEPDNHLDLAAKEDLERTLARFGGTVVLISHDRYLLDLVADGILELDHGVATQYEGGYTEFVAERAERRARAEKAWGMEEKELQRLDAARRRIIAWSSGGQNEKMIRRARNIERRMERMPRTERPASDRRGMGLAFQAERGGDRVLQVKGLGKAFGSKELFRDLDLTLWRGERVGLVGGNGTGKSVLLKTILGQVAPDAGTVNLGPTIQVGHYAQEHEDLEGSRTPLDEIRRVRPMSEGAALGFLGRFLFDQAMATRPIARLSGGERSRLQMARLMLEAPNFLLLDEPTNHFDIASAEVLEDALSEYGGTVFVVSHDRYFLDTVATRIVELEGGRLWDYPDCNYTLYLAEREKQRPKPTR